MVRIIDATREVEAIQALDATNFLSPDYVSINSSVSVASIDNIIKSYESEILNDSARIFKYTCESVLARLKADIDYQPVSSQTCKDIIEDILLSFGLTYDSTLYTFSYPFQGDRPFGVDFGKFEKYNALNIIYNLLAIDNMVMVLQDDNTLKFIPNNRNNNTTLSSLYNLAKSQDKNNVYSGIVIYNSEQSTSEESKLVEYGNNGKPYVSLFFNKDAAVQAYAFARNLIDNFSVPLEYISFNSNQNLSLGDCFNINLPLVDVVGDYMIEKKQTRIENGTISYFYRAYKKNQMLQFFHNKSFIDSIFRYNNAKVPYNFAISESIYDDGTNVTTLNIDSYSVFVNTFGVPSVRIKMNKQVKSSFQETDFRLYWGS